MPNSKAVETRQGTAGRRRARRHRVWWIWVGYWVILFALTHVPPHDRLSIAVNHLDKVVHFVLYAGLTCLGGYSHRIRYRKLSVASLVSWGVIYAAFAAWDEWSQGWIGRIPSLGDWVADVAGIAVGTAFWLLLRSPPVRGAGQRGSGPSEVL
jgi:VanZ family protein